MLSKGYKSLAGKLPLTTYKDSAKLKSEENIGRRVVVL